MSEKTTEEITTEMNALMFPEVQEDDIAWHEGVRFKYISSIWVVTPE
jgi:hypothetical protein